MPSSTKQSSFSANWQISSAVFSVKNGKMPNTCCGIFCRLTFCSSSCPTSMTSVEPGTLFSQSHWLVAMMVFGGETASNSPMVLGPSAINKRSVWRNFFCSNRRISFILFLLSGISRCKISQNCGILP